MDKIRVPPWFNSILFANDEAGASRKRTDLRKPSCAMLRKQKCRAAAVRNEAASR